MKYIYLGKEKININGQQYHEGDTVELENLNKLKKKLFKIKTQKIKTLDKEE